MENRKTIEVLEKIVQELKDGKATATVDIEVNGAKTEKKEEEPKKENSSSKTPIIKITPNNIEIEGRKIDICALFTMLVKHLHEDGIMTKEEIKMAVETGFKSEEEMKDEAKELIKNILGKIFGFDNEKESSKKE